MKLKYLITSLFLLITTLSCQFIPEHWPETGVSQRLAKKRAEQISHLNYQLIMDVPEDPKTPILAQSLMGFTLSSTSDDLFLDFKADSAQLKQIIINGDTLVPRIVNEHIKLPSSSLAENNLVAIDFIMGNGPLNRNDDYFYSLFVPDRARSAIPCFDQPDIKGEFSVIMTIPEEWTAIANGRQIISQALTEGLKTVEFAKSKPISTYLWAFAAGKFEQITTNWKGINIGLFHMLDDTIKINRNSDIIFDQTIKSLEWLENYTDYKYPYETYNLVAIPSFQFGGMEHPGATYYRSELIFLDSNPTPNEALRRANLIAHETAHMWFGDLVTMPWFDEVWLKEVFANYMADKITQPWFPDMNHQLRFLMAHFPSAYSVDRTEGTNPVNQKLNNLENAGTLYGSIIYHKSPIVMAQLESMVGSDNLRLGIQEYISNFAFTNASWNNLIDCIDKLSENDLKVWSNAWVNEPGRPVIAMRPPDQLNPQWRLAQNAEFEELSSPNTYWPQEIAININFTSSKLSYYDAVIEVDKEIAEFNTLIFCDEKGYGLFRMNQNQIAYWMNNTALLDDPLLRGRSTINLYENFWDGSIDPMKYVHFLLDNIKHEEDPLLVSLYGDQLKSIFWYTIEKHNWHPVSTTIEEVLLQRINLTKNTSIKKILFRLWIDIALSEDSLKKMALLCEPDAKFYDFPISEKDQIDIVSQLAIKNYHGWEKLHNTVISQLKNEDLKSMMSFTLPALSSNLYERDQFWSSLSNIDQRKKEKWVEQALSYLHHPVRSELSIKYLSQTLALLEDIQITGDIFFPVGWLQNSIGRYSSDVSIALVNQFLKKHPNYPNHLRMKILQNIDLAKRSVLIKNQFKGID